MIKRKSKQNRISQSKNVERKTLFSEFFQFIERMGMFIGMGMFMAKDAYGAPPDLSENMFSNFESTEEYQITCQEC